MNRDIVTVDKQSPGSLQPKRGGKALRVLLAVSLASVLIHMVHATTLDRIIEYSEVLFVSSKVTKAMDGYRIAFVSDIHELSSDALADLVTELNNRHLDLLILGGDYTSNGLRQRQVLQVLSGVATVDGVFGVEGNHDNRQSLAADMEASGVLLLANCGIRVRDGFYLAGVSDYWAHNANIAIATTGASADDFVLLVSHNPDVTMVQSSSSVDLILAGHTHGGHITLFGLFAPALLPDNITDYNHRFLGGWSTALDGTPVYVSRGVGKFANVPRVFARPQVVILTLQRA